MQILSYIFAVFALLGALDRIFGNRFGLGEEFETGFMLLGNMALTMIGMLSLAPVIAQVLSPVFLWINNLTGLDPSFIPAMLFANDMGAAPLSKELALTYSMGGFMGLTVSSMMGCTVSYTLPFALGVVKKEQHKDLLLGLLCGISTIPLGAFIGGLFCDISIPSLIYNLLPLIIFTVIVIIGLLFFQELAVKVFGIFGTIIKILVTIGLALALWQFLTGQKIIASLDSFENGAYVCFNAAACLAGAFPLMHIVSKLLKRPLKWLETKTGMNEASVMGLVMSLVSSTPVLSAMDKMDKKGVVLNSAFAVSAAFTFGCHLAFTLAFDVNFILPTIIAKLIAGILSLFVCRFILSRQQRYRCKNE